ncbi:MAG: MFS transporter, partial [Planctomycetes bacterium]|nr:MFS transporter [Planctomycetota bacterium]
LLPHVRQKGRHGASYNDAEVRRVRRAPAAALLPNMRQEELPGRAAASFAASVSEAQVESAHLQRKRLWRFLFAVGLMGIVGGLFETTFNNYLADIFRISAEARGQIEFPREMPGFLVTLVAGALASVVLNRAGAIAMFLVAAGLLGMAFSGGSLTAVILFMMIWSTGAHLAMPVTQSITLSLAGSGRRGARLGQMGMASVAGAIVGAGIVATIMRQGWISFRGVYVLAAVFAVAAGITVLSMGRVERPGQARRTAFVFKRRYLLYYILSALFGARKQIFMTFGPWVLIRIFARPAYTFANLWLIYSVLGLFARPLVGRLIDAWGERKTLVSEGAVLMSVCLTYAVAGRYGESNAALYAVMAAYVLDQLAFAMSMARTTYLSKIVERPEDLPGGLAAGVSIDHAVSMTVPLLGGLVWMRYGFEYVFWGAAAIAVASSTVSFLIRVPKGDPEDAAEAGDLS